MNRDVTVREAMTRDYVGVSEGDSIVDAASLLAAEEAPAAVVLRGQEPVGLLTQADILGLLPGGGALSGVTVADGMTDAVPTVSPEHTVADAAEMLFSNATDMLVVVDDGPEPTGVLTRGDVAAATTLEPTREETTVASATAAATTTARSEETFDDQGICERCGSLAGELTDVDGQLLCADCRGV